MNRLLSLITLTVLSSVTLAIPADTNSTLPAAVPVSPRQTAPLITSGYGDDGYFYYYSSDIAGQSSFENQDGGTYSMTWSVNGWYVAGKGWNPGTPDRVINYNGTFSFDGNTMFGVEGWTRQPLISYLIIESYGGYNPAAGAIRKGAITCDGAQYDVSAVIRVNQDSIDGKQTYMQYWSTRYPRKLPVGVVKGSVDFGCHVAGWKSLGLELGTEFDYQIVATDAYFNTGTSTVTVS